jgi:preprotein translocase subunit SecB
MIKKKYFRSNDMKIDFKGITAEELSFKLNRVKLAPQDKLDIKPQFSRQVRKVNGNDKLNFIALSVKIASTDEEPKPFNLDVTLVGIYEIEVDNPQEERDFVVQATKELYPYLRSAVTNLTASAYISPLNLPVLTGPLFPEDRDVYAFTVS